MERRQRRYLWLSLLLFRATQKWKTRCLSHPIHLKRDLPQETDEMRMETDDHAAEIPVPEPHTESRENVDLQWNTKEASNLE